jgi:hypothetical protein
LKSTPTSSLIIVNAPSEDSLNNTWRATLDLIIDNRKLVSQLHFEVSATVIGYHRPAEKATPRQLRCIEGALELLVAAGKLEAADIPRRPKNKMPRRQAAH